MVTPSIVACVVVAIVYRGASFGLLRLLFEVAVDACLLCFSGLISSCLSNLYRDYGICLLRLRLSFCLVRTQTHAVASLYTVLTKMRSFAWFKGVFSLPT